TTGWRARRHRDDPGAAPLRRRVPAPSLAPMTAEPSWKGTPLDAATALALLDWQREMGADEPILDDPVDRYAEIAPAPAPASPQPALSGIPAAASAAAPAPQIDLTAQATAMAARAGSLSELAALMQDFDGLEIRRGAR